MPIGEPHLEADVATIDQPERRQRVPEPGRERLDGVRGVDAQDADSREVFRILRKHRHGGAQPQRERGGNAVHSMTSSARARIDGGTVSASALAVLRLTTSSNVVGC